MKVVSYYGYKNARVVRSSWLQEGGRRLDCTPYTSGALEARDTLRRLPVRKDALNNLTTGYAGGIYNGPMFKRNYVESPEYGVPFISSGSMLLADLSNLPLLRRKDAESPRLSYLRLQPGTTLISCSGTVGRMAYVRPDMDGMWSSQDVMKVVPDPARIPPGYLYAFLSSRYGVPLVVSGTYGAIIQHIEPAHITDLPVPRFDRQSEQKISKLIEAAGSERTTASQKRRAAITLFEKAIGWTSFRNITIDNQTMASALLRRMDALYHSAKVELSKEFLSTNSSLLLSDQVAQIFEPGRGPRLKVDDPVYGIPFLSSSAVFEVSPDGEYCVSRSLTPNLRSLLISANDILLPRSGQLGGIIGRAVLPLAHNIGNAGSEHLVRVRCRTISDAAYLWTALASEPGYWAILGTAFGTSIPSLDPSLIGQLKIPWLKEKHRSDIEMLVREGTVAQDRAITLENDALQLLERMISGDD